MISAISWVPKGASKPVPEDAEQPSKEEMEEMLRTGVLETMGDSEGERDGDMDVDANNKIDAVARALAVAEALGNVSTNTKLKTHDIEDSLRELDMDHYDDEDDGIDIFGAGLGSTYYASNDMDPYLKDVDDDDSEELEDMTIKAEDSIIVCARNEDDVSHLEIWILEDAVDGEANMYVHRDLIIPAFPLCTAWLDFQLKGGEKGNFIAVGSMEPFIEIWDLDMKDEVLPSLVLGGIVEKSKKGKKKSKKYKEGSHTSSVLDLAWNKEYRNVLASASADKLVKVWDLDTGKCHTTMDHHSDKVQAVAWNHYARDVLLSGSFDHSVVMKDVRAPSHGYNWPVAADVERVAWDPHTEHSFVTSLENGTVAGFDIRVATSNDASSKSKPSFILHAHDKAVCSVSYNLSAPNLLATGSEDKVVKLWDLSNNQPSCIASKNPNAGAIFSVSFSEDCPFLLAVGGSKGKLELWDISSEPEVSKRFGRFKNQKNSN